MPGRPAAHGRRVARPPGPSGLDFLRTLVVERRPATELFTEAARRHPRLAHTRLGREHVYLLNHPETARDLLVTQGRGTVKGRALQRSKQLLGDGLLTSEGELWRRQRRLVQPAFHHERIAAYASTMVEEAEAHAAARWHDGSEIDVASDMAALTLAIVGRALFGRDLRGEAAAVGAALGEMVGQFQRRVLPGSELLDRLPLASNRRSLAAMGRLDDVVARLVAGARETTAAPGAPPTILDALVAAGMPDRQVRDEVMTLVLAGHETTANLLTWAWVLLAADTAARDRLDAELDAVLGAPPDGRPATAADLPALPWTTAVVAETLRLYPPAWAMGRRLTVDAQVDGWTLPAGSLAVASQWVLHRDPGSWSAPEEFRPDRWLDAAGRFDEAAPGQPRGAWFPFGVGQRVCIGEPFAWAEAVLVLGSLAHAWRVEVSPAYGRRLEPAVTLRPRDPVPAVLRSRR